MLPPYGKILKAYQEANIPLPYSIMLYVGKTAFVDAKRFMSIQPCLCLPLDSDPASYEWPVKGLRIVIDDTGGVSREALEDLAWYLLYEQAETVCLHSPLFPENKIFLQKDIV